MQLNGAEIVIECLKEQGVDTVFGYPGGAILNVYDELYKHRDEIRHILTSHEQGAAHAADGYARATGKVGVCLATSGPGKVDDVKMRFVSRFARFQNWDENDLVTRHVVGSKLNDGNGSESDPLGPPVFSGGSANITGNGEDVPF